MHQCASFISNLSDRSALSSNTSISGKRIRASATTMPAQRPLFAALLQGSVIIILPCSGIANTNGFPLIPAFDDTSSLSSNTETKSPQIVYSYYTVLCFISSLGSTYTAFRTSVNSISVYPICHLPGLPLRIFCSFTFQRGKLTPGKSSAKPLAAGAICQRETDAIVFVAYGCFRNKKPVVRLPSAAS